jgi:predicted phage-related endonuclease
MSEHQPAHFVVAQLNTNDYIWQGAGRTEDEAKAALLAAWHLHREQVVRRHPALAATLPEAAQLLSHFRVHYAHYVLGGGYRDGDRLV